jgi:peroxin-14
VGKKIPNGFLALTPHKTDYRFSLLEKKLIITLCPPD